MRIYTQRGVKSIVFIEKNDLRGFVRLRVYYGKESVRTG
jgi:hypothetical protein